MRTADDKGSALDSPPRENMPLETAGAATMLAGLGAMAVGVPLIVAGHRRESVRSAIVSVSPPPVAAGGGAMLDMRF